MRASRFLAFLPLAALLAFAGKATSQVYEAVSLGSTEAELPPVSARPPAGFQAALERLPPGVRSPAPPVDLRSVAAVDDAGASPGGRWVERIEGPPGPDGAPGWLEVEYTIDPELDAIVRDVLERSRVPLGHVILMDPASGEVLSYVSTAPEMFPATRPYPAASLMKVVTAAAVLRRAPEAAGRDCRYVGSPYELRESSLDAPSRGGQVDSFWRALALSNNQCFARLAVRDLGEEALLEELRGAGLLEPPAAQHPAGRIDPVRDALDLGELGSGLAGSFITPLAAVRLAALLLRGELVRPYWIARIRDSEGHVLAVPGRQAPRPVWSVELADALRELLVGVTTRGTARRAFRDEQGEPLLGTIRVSGKTGSLSGRNPEGRYQWFIGVAPADAPRIAIAAVVVNGPLWWSSATQVAARTLRALFCGSDGACPGTYVEQVLARAEIRDAAVRAPAGSGEPTALVDAAQLDRTPTPVGGVGLTFPRKLLRRKVDGEIVLLVELDATGDVVDVAIASSDLPEFDDHVLEQVRGWRFTPPTQQGRPVEVTARLPIPIHIR